MFLLEQASSDTTATDGPQKYSPASDFQAVWQSVGELCTAVARELVSAAIGFFQKLPASLLPLPCSSDLAWLYRLFDTVENQITF